MIIKKLDKAQLASIMYVVLVTLSKICDRATGDWAKQTADVIRTRSQFTVKGGNIR